jgi:hypothetical protein
MMQMSKLQTVESLLPDGEEPTQLQKKARGMMRALLRSLGSAVLLAIAACSGGPKLGPDAVAGLSPSGYIDMRQFQAAYIASGSGGSGTLSFNGQNYPFSIGGVGIGGIGASSIDATGEVYKLNDLAGFPGSYGQARYGFAVGSASAGDLWMQNEKGVIMHLKAKRTGLILSLGGDVMVITLSQ